MAVSPVPPAGALRFAWAPRPGLHPHQFRMTVRSRQDFYK